MTEKFGWMAARPGRAPAGASCQRNLVCWLPGVECARALRQRRRVLLICHTEAALARRHGALAALAAVLQRDGKLQKSRYRLVCKSWPTGSWTGPEGVVELSCVVFFETSLRHPITSRERPRQAGDKRTAKACQSASEIEIRAAYDVV